MAEDIGSWYEPGTINMILLTNMRLTPRGMQRAIISATEAKTAALQDLDIRSSYTPMVNPATGTGTDNIIVVQGAGTRIDNAGGHSKMGELIARMLRLVQDERPDALEVHRSLERIRDQLAAGLGGELLEGPAQVLHASRQVSLLSQGLGEPDVAAPLARVQADRLLEGIDGAVHVPGAQAGDLGRLWFFHPQHHLGPVRNFLGCSHDFSPVLGIVGIFKAFFDIPVAHPAAFVTFLYIVILTQIFIQCLRDRVC